MNHTCTKLKTRQQNRVEANAGKKVRLTPQVGPDSHEWLLAQDVANEKRKREVVDDANRQPTIELGYASHDRLNPAFLGPSLKRLFIG